MNEWITKWQEFLNQNPVLNVVERQQTLALHDTSPEELATNEVFWSKVRDSFPKPDGVINLNNGAVSSGPFVVEKAFTSYYALINTSPSYYIWKVMENGRELIRDGLARLINSSAEEIAILRNTTEALNNVIFGISLQKGDEVVACKQDYAKTVSSWKQRELRDGILIKWIEIDGTESNEDIIAKYVSAFTSKTKFLSLTHVINWNGQVLPVEAIIKEAKKKNIKVMLDAAHSFGVLETDVKKLDCDYFTTALHKWLSGPIPSGLLYIKKELIAETWPLASSNTPLSENIRKFEELSIQLLPNVLGLGYAIEFHLHVGRPYKEERLRFLRNFWVNQICKLPGISFKTPLNEEQNLVMVNLSLQGWEPLALETELLNTYQIHVGSVLWDKMEGIRVTVNIYTHPADIQKFVEALVKITSKQLDLVNHEN
ncbi:MAG: aminotransferase class [Sphingobacteriales bacterium]|nr:aminotransferase class [Sphingobacteriales bacterium]